MNVSCPNEKCPSYGKRKQWYKSDCGHSEYIDTDLDVYCHKKCNWPSGCGTYCFIGKLYWKCSDCKTCDKYALNTISASLGKVMSGLTLSLIKNPNNAYVKSEIETLAAIIDKCSERIRQGY